MRFANVQWKSLSIPKVNSLDKGVFLFSFDSMEKRDLVLGKRWTFYGNPLVLKPWTPDFDVDNLEMEKLLVWIQLPHLRLGLYNPEPLEKVVSYIGKPIATDRLTAHNKRLEYARVLVEMEVKEELVTKIPLKLPNGKIKNQTVVYEWKPLKCAKCGKFGHYKEFYPRPPPKVG